jgi:hypothetical protein
MPLTRNLVEIDTNAMILRITIKEHPKLEELIWAVLNAGNHAPGRESRLLNIAMIILRILVQDKFSKFLHLLFMSAQEMTRA